MRTMLLGLMAIQLALTAPAFAGEQEKPAPEESAPAASQAEATAKAAEKPFTPPPGWQAKKRGKFIVYCRKQAQMGSRIAAETCYDEQGIRDMLAAQREDREKVDQMRRICGSMDACGGGG